MDRREVLRFLCAAAVALARAARAQLPASLARGEIPNAFLAAGGGLVDSSPMYGSSEAVVVASSTCGRTCALTGALPDEASRRLISADYAKL